MITRQREDLIACKLKTITSQQGDLIARIPKKRDLIACKLNIKMNE
jgi:hypothetical protein